MVYLYLANTNKKEKAQNLMTRREDARVKKTKSKLFLAFKELLAEKTFEEITINEICERADIRRATFYKHFTDKYNFLAVMTASFIQCFDARMSRSKLKSYPVEFHVEYERKLVRFLVENEEIVDFALKSNMLPTLVSIIVEEHYKILRIRLTHSVENGERLICPVDTAAVMLSGGIGQVLVTWLKEGRPTPEEELTEQIESIVRAMFR